MYHDICVTEFDFDFFSHPAEDWKAVNEDLQKSCRYVIKNLRTGDRLKIRVVAVNVGGRSSPVALPEPVLVKEVAGEAFVKHLKNTVKFKILQTLNILN